MATFEELMHLFRNPGDDGLPDSFADDLAAAHSEELSVRDAAVSARDGSVAEIQEKLNAATAEQLRLKAVNYDLLMAAPNAGTPENQDNGNDSGGDDAPRGIDSLFE